MKITIKMKHGMLFQFEATGLVTIEDVLDSECCVWGKENQFAKGHIENLPDGAWLDGNNLYINKNLIYSIL